VNAVRNDDPALIAPVADDAEADDAPAEAAASKDPVQAQLL